METVITGGGLFRIALTVQDTGGNGLVVSVFGGQRPHVGGVAVAIPRVKSRGSGLTCDVSQICLPGHKDVQVASDLAKLFATSTGEPASVTVGIHVDNASDEDIMRLAANARTAAERWLFGKRESGDDERSRA